MKQNNPWLVVVVSWLALALPIASPASAQSSLEAASATQPTTLLPLAYEKLSIEVDGQHAEVVLEQAYDNPTSEQLEGRYLLHTEALARVHGFSYWHGEREIVGEVFEREEAQAVYTEVTGIGRDPGLFEQVAEGTFSFRIFPIEPGERKRVKVRYAAYLPIHGQRVTLRIPIASDRSEARLTLHDARGIRGLSSGTHTLSTKRIARDRLEIAAVVARGHSEVLELELEVDEPPLTLSGGMHRDLGHDGYVRLHLATPVTTHSQSVVPKDVTIVIDHSGSMSGEPLTQARAAASQIVSRLAATDRVNLVVFDDHAEALFATPEPVSDDVRRRALRRIETLTDGGGTNIALALETSLSAQNHDDHPNYVLFMTDGQSDAQAALAAAHADRTDTRVFTVGLGAGVERPLLARLAADKRGRFVFIPDTSAIEREVSRLYAQIAAPLLTGVHLESEGASLVDVYPRSLPDLFVDDELAVYARVLDDGKDPMAITARLVGTLAGKRFVAETRLASLGSSENRPVAFGWAKARVDDLLEEIALQGERDELKSEVIDLALAYDFVTPYTSFLALPASELNEQAADMLASARERKRRIRDAHPDAVALSRTEMPPGDPIIAVRAPRSAQAVTARFPFGLVLDLAWDELTERWSGRFLVPQDVPDGVYDVEVWIVRADGKIERGQTRYVIDSSAPTVSIDVRSVPGGLVVRLSSDEPLAEARAVLVDALEAEAELGISEDGSCAFAFLPASPGVHALRIVASDRARNEHAEALDVVVTDQPGLASVATAEVCP